MSNEQNSQLRREQARDGATPAGGVLLQLLLGAAYRHGLTGMAPHAAGTATTALVDGAAAGLVAARTHEDGRLALLRGPERAGERAS